MDHFIRPCIKEQSFLEASHSVIRGIPRRLSIVSSRQNPFTDLKNNFWFNVHLALLSIVSFFTRKPEK